MHRYCTRRSFLGLAATILVAAATSRNLNATAESTGPATPGATPRGAFIEHPQGAADVVVRIEQAGGLMMLMDRLRILPLVSLYGDGRLVTMGPQIAIFPPPALPNLRQLYLTEDGIQVMLDAARKAGLTGPDREYENPNIADAPSTVFTVHAAGDITHVSVDALGVEGGAAPEEHKRLQHFQSLMTDVSIWLPDAAIASGDEPYPIERIQVVAQPYDASATGPDAAEQQPIEWPLDSPISAFTSPMEEFQAAGLLTCGVVAGDEASAIVEAATNATTLTPWVSEGETYSLSLRPLLPDETGCPAQPLESGTPSDPVSTPT